MSVGQSWTTWPTVSYRAWRVWERNRDTYLRLWATELWPPFVEPIFYLVALGLGLGSFVANIEGRSYLEFLAPGIMAEAVMFAAAFECTYGSYIRMEYQKTFDAIIATPVSIEDVIAGEIFWGTTRGLMTGTIILLVIWAFGLVHSPLAIIALLISALSAFMFSGLSMFFTAIAPSINSLNYFITLGLTPMFLFSGVFFPISAFPEVFQRVAWFSPLTHAVVPIRSLVYGEIYPGILADAAWMLALGTIMFYLSLMLMRRRLIK